MGGKSELERVRSLTHLGGRVGASALRQAQALQRRGCHMVMHMNEALVCVRSGVCGHCISAAADVWVASRGGTERVSVLEAAACMH